MANWMIRHEDMSAATAATTFAKFRSPGIYKDSYISQLFKYNHEARCLPWSTSPTRAILVLQQLWSSESTLQTGRQALLHLPYRIGSKKASRTRQMSLI